MNNWYNLKQIDVLEKLETNPDFGIGPGEVRQRLELYGFNELKDCPLESPWKILWEQLTATVVVVLIVAGVISAVLGEYKDAIAILTIVAFNAFLGFRQEYQAECAIAALKKLAVPTVKVRRQGTVDKISARELVPGDIVMLETGNLIPADCRLLESFNLRISEASLTGESEPVDKFSQEIATPNLPLAERLNMAYMGTVITSGRAMAVVTETGMNTELGQIAGAIQNIEREATPLQERLDQLGGVLAIAILVLVLTIFSLGLLRGEEIKLMFLMAVSLAVAAIPEGLPAVVTIALALGAQRMLKRRALIRKLPAVETLGSVTTICSDKTGTITENRMTVTCLEVMGHHIDLTEVKGEGLVDSFSLIPNSQPLIPTSLSPLIDAKISKLLPEKPTIGLLLTAAALCNDALLEPITEDGKSFQTMGDPTEISLVVAAANFGLLKSELEQVFRRIDEIPFDSQRKRMTTIHQRYLSEVRGEGLEVRGDEKDLINLSLPVSSTQSIVPNLEWLELENSPYIAFTKGAVDSLLQICTKVWVNGNIAPLNNFWYKQISEINDQLAGDGIRVLGVAFKLLEQLETDKGKLANDSVKTIDDTWEQDLIFIGMMGIIDPARREVKEAVFTCEKAGIRPVMITGDHPLTARYIASELGISHNSLMLTGQDLEQLSAQELEDIVEQVSVYARVSPQHKLDIVHALQNRGHIVAMTGDGVNDAPALKKADIGVAMGIAGTDVAKESADMVLLDDNFATIVAATQEGRAIYDNIRKFIKYTLTGNCGELWVILFAPFLGMPLPLLPLQILWINLLADGLLALALGVEAAEPNIMSRPPHNPKENIFSRGVGRDIVWIGLLIGIVLLGIDYKYWSAGEGSWQTMVFSTLAFCRIGLAQSMRSERVSLFRMNILSNKPLLGAVILTFILQLLVVYVPVLQNIFHTIALSPRDLLISLALSSVAIWAMELDKWRLRYF